MRVLFVVTLGVSLLAGAALAQPVLPLTGSGSLRPAPSVGSLNVPAFITHPSAGNPPPSYAPRPTTPVQEGQFSPAPLPAAPAFVQPGQVPPPILERIQRGGDAR